MLKLVNYRWLLMLMATVFVAVSCDEEDEITKVVASFQIEQDPTDFRKVTFKNFSQNAVSYSWNFGDNSAASTEAEPVHTYEAGGKYTVTLTATGVDGSVSSKDEEITINDPDTQLTLLAGAVSKEWSLVREGASIGIGPDANNWTQWFSLSNDGSRNCLYDDTFTFHRDGKFTYDDNGTFWGEGDVWKDTEYAESCFDNTDAAFTVNGVNVSAWRSNEHAYTYDATAGKITLNGEGVWLGLVKLGTEGYVTTPQSSLTVDATVIDGEEVDTLIIDFNYASIGNFWRAIYVSPNTVEISGAAPKADFTFEMDGPNKTVTFTNMSVDATTYSWDFGDGETSTDASPVHQYAADGKYVVKLTASNDVGESVKTVNVFLNVPETEVHDIAESFSGEPTETTFDAPWVAEDVTFTLGAADPSGTGAFGKYVRGTAPGANLHNDLGYEIDLSTRNVFKMMVYFPSDNDYVTEDATAEVWANPEKSLSMTISLKLQNSQSNEPWNGQAERRIEITTDELDQWVEVTFDFSEFAASNVYDRVLMQFGGEGHKMPGTFYMSNLELQ